MLANYAHLTDDDIESEYCERLGIMKVDRTEETASLEPRQCPKCKTLCSPMSNFCNLCGSALTKEASDELEMEVKFIEQQFSPDDMEMLKKLLAKMKSESWIISFSLFLIPYPYFQIFVLILIFLVNIRG